VSRMQSRVAASVAGRSVMSFSVPQHRAPQVSRAAIAARSAPVIR